MTDRRSFLQRAGAAAGALGLGALPRPGYAAVPDERATRARSVDRAPESLSILVIGGTGFTGPEQVEHALARGHRVTVINRNRTRPDFFKGNAQVEQLVGDLNADMSALRGRTFDAVLDIPTTAPYWVRNVAQYMKGHTKHYTFISTISVYADNRTAGADESAPTLPMPADLDPFTPDPAARGRYYGQLKAFCEGFVKETYPESLIIRPGLIVGPLDRSDRFTYWPVRIDKGGEVMAPGDPTDPVQFIDSRDLAEWTIRMIEAKATGTYNATGPDKPLTIAEMLYGIKAVTTAGAQFTWVPADFLAEHEVRGWRHMPVWVPQTPDTAGFSTRSTAKAVASGLTFRPLAVTAKETLDWAATRTPEQQKALEDGAVAGISMAREAEVLAAWHARKRSGSN
ncbi:MAG TPA: NAD-dependent epimerase/dehydratase family protein [Gemmatimonadaceae bacterium]|nr:NAD-dependent epimerase/dehydratase family protein [Gemmatimonadaceae bacterium]